MPSENTNTLKFNQSQKSDKAPLIIYADLEHIIEKNDGCKNNPKNSSATKVSKHIPSSFSMSTTSSFRSLENTHVVCTGKDCMKKVLEFLREYTVKTYLF